MRTTVALEPDVEDMICAEMRQKGVSFDAALNAAVRIGLSPEKRKGRFVQKSFSLGAEQRFPWKKALEVAEVIEDEEITRSALTRE